jgi:hypothetical protein
MVTNLIDLRQPGTSSNESIPALSAYLAQLIGEPFQFARVSYGDELTLHFGDLRPARSPRLRKLPYGDYILGMRGSSWVLKSGAEPVVITAGEVFGSSPSSFGTPLRKDELESGTYLEPGCRVIAATPFLVRPVDGFGLQLRMSDGSSLLVLPTSSEPDEVEDEDSPELADWELLSPRGLLSAGPALQWTFTPTTEPSPNRSVAPIDDDGGSSAQEATPGD